jgi:predicted TIM-barrel fold metal-dependent hydrolase
LDLADCLIIDSHVHIGKWNFLVQDSNLSEVARELSKHGICRFVAMITPDGKSTKEDNLKLMGESNANISFFYWIDPKVDSVEEIKSISHRISGLKLHPSYAKCRISDPKIKPFLDLLEEMQKPLIVHCGRFGEYSSYTFPVDISADYTFPIILAHMGGPPYHMKAQALLYIRDSVEKNGNSNLYVDTSTCFQPFLIKKAVEYMGEDKVIFGSDYPLYHPLPSMQTVLISEIPDKVKQAILGENFQRLLKY